jgi:hypothetical protein
VDYGSWFDYTRDWEKVMAANPHLNVFTINYEDMKEVRHTQTDRQEGRQAGRQADRQTDRQAGRQTHRHTHTHTHRLHA